MDFAAIGRVVVAVGYLAAATVLAVFLHRSHGRTLGTFHVAMGLGITLMWGIWYIILFFYGGSPIRAVINRSLHLFVIGYFMLVAASRFPEKP